VYVPFPVNFKIVFEPVVVIVTDPVYSPEYVDVGTDNITTPDPPEPGVPNTDPNPGLPPPPPPPVLVEPEVAAWAIGPFGV
jgi:hypothetical protein